MTVIDLLKILRNFSLKSKLCVGVFENNFLQTAKINSFKAIERRVFLCSVAKAAVSSEGVEVSPQKPQFKINPQKQYLLQNPKFSKSIFREEELLSTFETNSKSLKKLRELTGSEDHVESLNAIKSLLSEELKNLSFDELLQVVGLLLSKFGKQKSDTLNELVAVLNDEFQIRGSSWSFDEILKAIHLLSQYDLDRKFRFYKINIKLTKLIKNLTPPQIIQIMYFQKIYKLRITKYLFEIQKNVNDNISNFNHKDLAILAVAYSNKCYFPEFGEALLEKILQEFDTVDDWNLFLLANALKEGFKPSHINLLNDVKDKMMGCTLRFSLKTLVMMASTGLLYNSYHMDFFKKVVEACKDTISTEFDSKAITGLTYLTVRLNYRDEELFNLITKRFESNDNNNVLSETKFVMHMIQQQIYPKSLLENRGQALLNTLLEKKIGLRYWWYNNCSFEIEKPEYYTPLDENTRKKVWTLYYYNPHLEFEIKRPFTMALTKRIEEVLKKLYGPDTFKYLSLLPHMDRMFLMKFDKNLNAQTIPKECHNFIGGVLLKPLDNEHIWLCLDVLMRPAYYKDEFTFKTQTKLRQLIAVGYKPVMIQAEEFTKVSLTDNAKGFIENLINSALQEEKLSKFLTAQEKRL